MGYSVLETAVHIQCEKKQNQPLTGWSRTFMGSGKESETITCAPFLFYSLPLFYFIILITLHMISYLYFFMTNIY